MRAFRYSDYVARIEGNVISADSLEEITFGSGLEYIGGSMLPNTTVLKKVTCRAVTPPATGFNNFDNTERMALHVPRNSIKLYHQELSSTESISSITARVCICTSLLSLLSYSSMST